MRSTDTGYRNAEPIALPLERAILSRSESLRSISSAVWMVSSWVAARASGAAPTTAARSIWLPAVAPALLGAWALVFLAALHEVTMSSLLYSFGNETFAVAVLNQQQLGGVGVTAALSVVLTALILLAAFPAALALRLRAKPVAHAL